MSERIRVEITEELNGITVTFAAEAISREDAVRGAMTALEEYDDMEYDDE